MALMQHIKDMVIFWQKKIVCFPLVGGAFTIMLLWVTMESISAFMLSPDTGASQMDLSQLPLVFPAQSAEVIDYFNQIARPEDAVYTLYRASDLLSLVTTGRKFVAFNSWSMAEQKLPELIGEIEGVMYDPEHWEYTPDEEKQNLPSTMKRASEYARKNDLLLIVAPDRKFVDAYLEDFAPYVDIVVLQGQRLQNSPESFYSWVTQKISIARAANPDILIYVQVGATRDTPAQMLAAIQTVSSTIDGVAIWSNPGSLNNLEIFIKSIREPLQLTGIAPTMHIPDSTTATPGSTLPVVQSTPDATSTPAPVQASEPVPTAIPSSANEETQAPGRIMILAGAVLSLCLLILCLLFLLAIRLRKGKD